MATEQIDEKNLRPMKNEYDAMHVEAQLERDIELRNYESKRLAANLRLQIAQNMGSKQLAEQAQGDLDRIESNTAESIAVIKQRLLVSVDRIFERFDTAMKTEPGQDYQQRIDNCSKAEMIYLAHMMNKDVVKAVDLTKSSAYDQNDLIIPLTVTPAGVTVYLLLSNGSLWINANIFSKSE